MGVPFESYLKLLDDPNLVIDSENSVFQFLWSSSWQYIDKTREISALSKINFDCLTEHFIDCVIQHCVDTNRAITQFILERAFPPKKNKTIPSITPISHIIMHNPQYKRQLKINIQAQPSSEYGLMSGQGYKFSFYWKNPNIDVHCTAGGLSWSHICQDELFNLTIHLVLKLDRFDGKSEYVIERTITFDKKHSHHEIKLFETEKENILTYMQEQKIIMIDGHIKVEHHIIFPQDQSEYNIPLTLPLNQ